MKTPKQDFAIQKHKVSLLHDFDKDEEGDAFYKKGDPAFIELMLDRVTIYLRPIDEWDCTGGSVIRCMPIAGVDYERLS